MTRRFLDAEQPVDFDDEGRDRVIEYVREKYGANMVAQIITYGTMAAKSAIRDAGRVFELPLPDTDRLAKLMPDGFHHVKQSLRVVTTFLLPSMNLQLRPTILAMKPGTRVVSNTFPFGDWEPDDTATIGGWCERWCKALFWIVPARVAGSWRTPKGDLTLTQKFQFVSGTLGKEPISGGRLRGEELTFTAGDTTYSARVADYRMAGTSVTAGKSSGWNAVRR